MASPDECPRPTTGAGDTRECSVTIDEEARGTLLDLVDRLRTVRDRLDDRRRERFRAGDSVYDVTVESVAAPGEVAALPSASLAAIDAASADRWRVAYRAMCLAGYPPAQSGGRSDRSSALELVREGESTAYRRLSFPTADVETGTGPAGGPVLRLAPGDGRRSIDLGVEPTVADALDSYDRLDVTVYSQRAREVIRSLGEAFSDTGTVTVSLDRARPRREYADADTGLADPGSRGHFDRLRAAPPLPAEAARRALASVLADGWFTLAEQLAIARLAAGETDTVQLRYGERVPRLVVEIGRLVGAELVGVPQRGSVLLTRSDLPDVLEELDAAFPERQRLSSAEREALGRAIGRPAWALASPDAATRGRVAERLASAAEAGTCSPVAAFYHEVSPWTPAPTAAAIEADRRTGERIVAAIEDEAPTAVADGEPTADGRVGRTPTGGGGRSAAPLGTVALDALAERATGSPRSQSRQ